MGNEEFGTLAVYQIHLNQRDYFCFVAFSVLFLLLCIYKMAASMT